MPFNFSSPEYLNHHGTRNNRVSPVSRASPAHMNSPLVALLIDLKGGGVLSSQSLKKCLALNTKFSIVALLLPS